MACTFGAHLLTSYHQAVSTARLSGSTSKNQALADVALVALLTHEKECRSCGAKPSDSKRSPFSLRFLFSAAQS